MPGRSTFAPSSLDSGFQAGVAEWVCEVGSARSVMFDSARSAMFDYTEYSGLR